MTSKTKLIIVDDEPDMIEILEWRLRSLSYTVFTAMSAKEALAVVSREKLDIVVTDICMPGMDGLIMMREARKLRPDVQFIFITAHGGRETAMQAIKLGAIGYHKKPVEMGALDLDIRKAREKLNFILTIRKMKQEIIRQQQIINNFIGTEPVTMQALDIIIQEAETKLEKIRQIKAMQKEIEQEEKKLAKAQIQDAIFDVMDIAVRYWELCTGKTKVNLADESKLWAVTMDDLGNTRARTMERYLRHTTIPKHPNYNAVLNTGEFVIRKCPCDKCPCDFPDLEKKLRARMDDLENMHRRM